MTMAAVAPGVAAGPRPWGWLREFLAQELAPYPGRVALVARMVLAVTVVMIVNMTFRIPYGAFGAIYALVISREDTQAIVRVRVIEERCARKNLYGHLALSPGKLALFNGGHIRRSEKQKTEKRHEHNNYQRRHTDLL
jgi:hypothetical protein